MGFLPGYAVSFGRADPSTAEGFLAPIGPTSFLWTDILLINNSVT
jgi:hypothetical protein